MALSAQNKFHILRMRNGFLRVFPWFARAGETMQFLRCVKRLRRNGWTGSPPYLIKRSMLKAEILRLKAKSFVETGTYMGDTIWALADSCERLISIEVQPVLADIASGRFRNVSQVEIITGDSATELNRVVDDLDGPILFWLDGHYSAGMTGRGIRDCPIFEELAAIARISDRIFSIMIDDARCFGTDPAYPTLDTIRSEARNLFPDHEFNSWNDVIHITANLVKTP
jgi:hypothetical protein